MIASEACSLIRNLLAVSESTTRLPNDVLLSFLNVAQSEVYGRMMAKYENILVTSEEVEVEPGQEAETSFASIVSCDLIDGDGNYSPLMPAMSRREIPALKFGQGVQSGAVTHFSTSTGSTEAGDLILKVQVFPWCSETVTVLVSGIRQNQTMEIDDDVMLGVPDATGAPMLVVYRTCQLAKLRLGEDPSVWAEKEEEAWTSFDTMGQMQSRMPPRVRNESW